MIISFQKIENFLDFPVNIKGFQKVSKIDFFSDNLEIGDSKTYINIISQCLY